MTLSAVGLIQALVSSFWDSFAAELIIFSILKKKKIPVQKAKQINIDPLTICYLQIKAIGKAKNLWN